MAIKMAIAIAVVIVLVASITISATSIMIAIGFKNKWDTNEGVYDMIEEYEK